MRGGGALPFAEFCPWPLCDVRRRLEFEDVVAEGSASSPISAKERFVVPEVLVVDAGMLWLWLASDVEVVFAGLADGLVRSRKPENTGEP